MDRMAQTALNSLKMIMENQTATSHNLANINTPGYKQDVAIDFSSVFLSRNEGIEPRIVSSRNTGGFSLEQGQMENTQNVNRRRCPCSFHNTDSPPLSPQ